jgi:uncharacterized protein YbbK (DUF523 family)
LFKPVWQARLNHALLSVGTPYTVDYYGKKTLIISVCPEVLGNLPTPRHPAKIIDGDGNDVLAGDARVVNDQGEDVTAAFKQGAFKALEIAQSMGATIAIMKSRSPSCGQTIPCGDKPSGMGPGVTAALFGLNKIKIFELDNNKTFLNQHG